MDPEARDEPKTHATKDDRELLVEWYGMLVFNEKEEVGIFFGPESSALPLLSLRSFMQYGG